MHDLCACPNPPPPLQPGYECWIGNDDLPSVTRHGRLPDANCSTPCGGSRTSACGGLYSFGLYEMI